MRELERKHSLCYTLCICLPLHLPQTAQSKSQFGVGLECLVPPDSTQVPAVLEKCLQYIEEHGQ